MKHLVLKVSAAIFMSSLLFSSCKKDDPEPLNEEELITTLIVNLTDVSSGATESFIFRDPDGEGGNPPTDFDAIIMESGKEYECSLFVLNESVSPAKDISQEILKENTEHQFYFAPSVVSTNVTITDVDANGLPLGLESIWNTQGPGVGTMTITLKHKPGQKSAGDPVSVGETDIEIAFITTVN